MPLKERAPTGFRRQNVEPMFAFSHESKGRLLPHAKHGGRTIDSADIAAMVLLVDAITVLGY